MKPDRDGIVRIGNPKGKIALYLDENEAMDVMYFYGPRDGAYRELWDAIVAAYPPTPECSVCHHDPHHGVCMKPGFGDCSCTHETNER